MFLLFFLPFPVSVQFVKCVWEMVVGGIFGHCTSRAGFLQMKPLQMLFRHKTMTQSDLGSEVRSCVKVEVDVQGSRP